MTEPHNGISAASDGAPLRQALIDITKLEGALRMGGPAPEDLEELSDALDSAVRIAGNALDKNPAQSPTVAQAVGMRKALEEIEEIAARPISGTTLQMKANRFDAIRSKSRAALAQPTPAATVDPKIGRVDREGGWNAGRDIARECSSAATEGETKLVYVKRWRTLVKLPEKYADEIVEALRGQSCPTCGGRKEIGGFDSGDNAYRTEPCPECTVPLNEPQTPWRPIETAPKDGTNFDAWLTFKSGKSQSYRKTDVWWCDQRQNWTWEGQWGGRLGPDIELTHWMPRPASPLSRPEEK